MHGIDCGRVGADGGVSRGKSREELAGFEARMVDWSRKGIAGGIEARGGAVRGWRKGAC